ncbi:hypothetical protein FQN57_006453 [Myotisia sp. PD_48]|nr:hypothetical protein FQN57_006453 [Myotisia sp. PD_48]
MRTLILYGALQLLLPVSITLAGPIPDHPHLAIRDTQTYCDQFITRLPKSIQILQSICGTSNGAQDGSGSGGNGNDIEEAEGLLPVTVNVQITSHKYGAPSRTPPQHPEKQNPIPIVPLSGTLYAAQPSPSRTQFHSPHASEDLQNFAPVPPTFKDRLIDHIYGISVHPVVSWVFFSVVSILLLFLSVFIVDIAAIIWNAAVKPRRPHDGSAYATSSSCSSSCWLTTFWTKRPIRLEGSEKQLFAESP